MMQDRNELDMHNLMLMCVIFIVHQHVSTITKPSVAISSAWNSKIGSTNAIRWGQDYLPNQ